MSEPMHKYKRALFVGRFQPFHKGHLYVIQKILPFVDELIIGIGTLDKTKGENLFTYEQRKEMIEKVLEQKRISKKITFVALEDNPDDAVWLSKTLSKTGHIDVVIGNNEWTNSIFEKSGYKVWRIGFYFRNLYEGQKIRKLIKERKHWEKRVPAPVASLVKQYL